MSAIWKLVAWMALLLSAILPVVAQDQIPPRIQAALFWETQSPAPGDRVQVPIRMTPERGWHGYWINPGDSCLPVTIEWQAPAGLSFGELRHPAPGLLDVQGIASYVHEGQFALLATLTVPKGLMPGAPLPIEAKLNWLAWPACSSSGSRCSPAVRCAADGPAAS